MIASTEKGTSSVTTQTIDKTRQAVEKGAEVLDQIKPDWRDRVNKSALDISNCFDCILGQVFGYFGDGMKAIRNEGITLDSEEMGFVCNLAEYACTCNELAEIWKEII